MFASVPTQVDLRSEVVVRFVVLAKLFANTVYIFFLKLYNHTGILNRDYDNNVEVGEFTFTILVQWPKI